MIKAGSIVTQSKTTINKVNFKDQKTSAARLSVVLFTYKKNDNVYYCTIPITNTKENFATNKKRKQNYVPIPFVLLGNTKLCCIKLDAAYLYNEKFVHDTGLTISTDILNRVYEKLINIEVEDYQEELYRFIKVTLKDLIEYKEIMDKKEEKRLKKERKLARKEKIRAAKRGN